MRALTTIEQAALRTVAEHVGATRVDRRGPSDVQLTVAGKRIGATVIAAKAPRRGRTVVREPRLRFDKVALRLVSRLRAALSDSIPERAAIAVTITAPIRVPGKTAARLEDAIRAMLAAPATRRRLGSMIHGNRIQVHVLHRPTRRPAKLVGFVHNPDSDPAVLVEITRSLLASIGPDASNAVAAARDHWLLIASPDGLPLVNTYRHVCEQLFGAPLFTRIIAVLPGARIAS